MTDPLIPMCCNCGTTVGPLITRAGRLICKKCYCPLGIDDERTHP